VTWITCPRRWWLRLSLPPEDPARLVRHVRAHEGVTDIAYSPVVRSLLIRFDLARVTREEIMMRIAVSLSEQKGLVPVYVLTEPARRQVSPEVWGSGVLLLLTYGMRLAGASANAKSADWVGGAVRRGGRGRACPPRACRARYGRSRGVDFIVSGLGAVPRQCGARRGDYLVDRVWPASVALRARCRRGAPRASGPGGKDTYFPVSLRAGVEGTARLSLSLSLARGNSSNRRWPRWAGRRLASSVTYAM